MTKIRYETETCSRCGGTGNYSYCQMHGTTCFKCRGTGKQLTKAANKACKAITVFKERYHRRAADLKPGQVVMLPHGMTGKKWKTIESVEENGLVSKSRQPDGTWKEYPQVEIKAPGGGLIVYRESVIEVRYSPEQFRTELLPFAKTQEGVIIET